MPGTKCNLSSTKYACQSATTKILPNSQGKRQRGMDSIEYSIGLVILVFMFIFLIIIINIRKTDESQISVLLRIFANYLQLISSMMSLNIKIPASITSIFSPVNQIGASSEVFLSFDCFVTAYDIKGPFSSNKVFKVFLTGLLPLILLIVFAVIWLWAKCMNKKLVPDLQRNIAISFISIVFLLYPRIVQSAFSMFECVSIDSGDKRSKINLYDSCYGSNHIKWVLAIALPIIVIWVVSMPLIALYLLYKNHNKNEDNKVKQYFLILYQGLKPRAYYWEFVNIFLKSLNINILQYNVLFLSTNQDHDVNSYADFFNEDSKLDKTISSIIFKIENRDR